MNVEAIDMQERYGKGVNRSEDGLKAFESRFVARDERMGKWTGYTQIHPTLSSSTISDSVGHGARD